MFDSEVRTLNMHAKHLPPACRVSERKILKSCGEETTSTGKTTQKTVQNSHIPAVAMTSTWYRTMSGVRIASLTMLHARCASLRSSSVGSCQNSQRPRVPQKPGCRTFAVRSIDK